MCPWHLLVMIMITANMITVKIKAWANSSAFPLHLLHVISALTAADLLILLFCWCCCQTMMTSLVNAIPLLQDGTQDPWWVRVCFGYQTSPFSWTLRKVRSVPSRMLPNICQVCGWSEKHHSANSNPLPGRLTLPVQDLTPYISEGRSHPRDYGKSILIWW